MEHGIEGEELWIVRSVDRVKRCDMYICMYLPCMIYEVP